MAIGATVGFDPATAFHDVAQAALGSLYNDRNGNIFKYVKFLDAVAYTAGQLVEWADVDLAYVTNDRAGGSAIGTQTAPAGVVLGVPTTGQFGYIQVAGVCDVQGDGSVAAGEAVVSHSVDGQADTMAAGEEHQVFGVALEADSGATNLFSCRLKGLV